VKRLLLLHSLPLRKNPLEHRRLLKLARLLLLPYLLGFKESS
jgi:hypothetical protein